MRGGVCGIAGRGPFLLLVGMHRIGGCPGRQPRLGEVKPQHPGIREEAELLEQGAGSRQTCHLPTRLRTQGGAAPPTRAVPVGLCPGRENLSGGWRRPGTWTSRGLLIHHRVRLVPDPETLPAHIRGEQGTGASVCRGWWRLRRGEPRGGGRCLGKQIAQPAPSCQKEGTARPPHPAGLAGSVASWASVPSLYRGTADAHPVGAWGGPGPAVL